MEVLIKYSLNKDAALKYLHWNLQNGNALCNSVLNNVCFEKGGFFTFLKEGLTEEKINNFFSMHVSVNSKEMIGKWLHEIGVKDISLILIFDEDDARVDESIKEELFSRVGAYYRDEVYYLLENNSRSLKNIRDCLQASDIIWHSLCIVSKYSYKKNESGSISREELEDIARNAEMILLLAYDAEGYIIWQKGV